MGIRGELFSTKVGLQNRTYFFNVKENRLGDLYLNIVESKNRETGGFDRQSVILFADDLVEFLKGFDESLRVLERAVKEKRRSPPRKAPPANVDAPDGRPPREDASPGAPGKRVKTMIIRGKGRESGGRPAPAGKFAGAKPGGGKPAGGKPAGRKPVGSNPGRPKRMVVRKRPREE